jgi:hypothetical protein
VPQEDEDTWEDKDVQEDEDKEEEATAGVALPLVRRASTCKVPRASLSDRYLFINAR